ncbi:reverse transcriptase, partial [Globisporangium splendens]
MWNYEKADLSCSNPECSQVVQSSVQHLFWECPKAKLVWNYFYALWTKIEITPGQDPAIWIFSLDLSDTPRHAWTTIKRHIIGHKFSNEHLQDHLYPVAHMLWRYMSASLIQTIWCAHLRRMDSDPIESTAEMAIMMTRLEAGMRNLTQLAEAQAGDSDGHTVAAVLKAYVDCFLSQTDAIPLTPNDTRGVYLLFFDDGSRGNPGPGGTGSIIVRVHKDSHTASLIWAASMAYSRKDTTNNFAEYWGLIHGLREAQRSHFEPLYVIGDSALIISQQRMHRSPRQHRLARLYQTSRRLADCIDILGWYHHYRAFNKMADSAANLAMDARTSTQVHFSTHRAAFNNLTQDLDDVMHWLMRSSEDPSLTQAQDLGSCRLWRHTAFARDAANAAAAAAGRRKIGKMLVQRNICDKMHVENHTVTSTQTDASELNQSRQLSQQREHLRMNKASVQLVGGVVHDARPDHVTRVALDPAHDDPRSDEQQRERREHVDQVELASLHNRVPRSFGHHVQGVNDDHRPVPHRPDHPRDRGRENRAVAEYNLQSCQL